MWLLPKTAPEVLLIALAVSETRAGGLGPTDAAAVQAPVHFWLVKAKHLHGKLKKKKNIYFFLSASQRLISVEHVQTAVPPCSRTFGLQRGYILIL